MAAAGPDRAAGDVEQPQAEPFGFPGPGGSAGQGEVLGPGEQVGGQGDQFQPDLVGGEVVQRQVAQSGVLQAADPVLGSGPQPVLHLQVGDPAAADVGREQGDAPAVGVGEAQLGSRVRSLTAG